MLEAQQTQPLLKGVSFFDCISASAHMPESIS